MKSLTHKELHEIFVKTLRDYCLAHSDPREKPLDLDLRAPLPHKIRLYIFNATHPPGGRTLGEHKIQLIVPGQIRGERANFDETGGRTVILAGYEQETEVFILWDSGMYRDFSYSRNVQVKAETVYAAIAGGIGEQERDIRSRGKEIVITSGRERLAEALRLRQKRTVERIIRERV